MSQEYTYPFSDFLNDKVSSDRLLQEINKSVIVTALDYTNGPINTESAVCYILFLVALSAGDKTILDGIVAAHTGEPLVPEAPIQRTRIVDTDTLDPAVAVSCTEDVRVPVVTGADVSVKDISFPFDINIIAAGYYVDTTDWAREDYFTAWGVAQGDPAVGGLTAPAAQDDTVIHVSSTVFNYVRPGIYVEFQDQPSNGYYRIDSMDTEAGTITLAQGLASAISAGKTLHPRRPFVPKKYARFKVPCRIGDIQSGSSALKAGDIMRVRYHHAALPTADDWLAFTVIYLF